jgi:hypothetical protein
MALFVSSDLHCSDEPAAASEFHGSNRRQASWPDQTHPERGQTAFLFCLVSRLRPLFSLDIFLLVVVAVVVLARQRGRSFGPRAVGPTAGRRRLHNGTLKLIFK